MRRLPLAVLTLGLAACADPVTYLQRVFVSPAPHATRVSNGSYQVDFPDEGIRLPSSIMISDRGEVLAKGTCPSESLLGVALYPLTVVAADTTNDGATSTFDVLEKGPGLVQVAVGYDVPHECTAMAVPGHLTGTSTFTFFPSGRIARRDAVRATTMPVTTVPGCDCVPTNPTNFIFTSYWKFNIGTVDIVGTNDLPILDDSSDAPASCATFGDDLIALRWMPAPVPVDRTRVSDPTMTNPAVVYDLYRGPTIDSTERVISSEVVIGYNPSGCSDAHRGLVHPPITIAGREIAQNADGYYEDLESHTGPFTILANDGDLAPFAVRLDIGSAKHVRVSRSETQYAVQPSENGGYLFWFDDGMNDLDTITIEPY